MKAHAMGRIAILLLSLTMASVPSGAEELCTIQQGVASKFAPAFLGEKINSVPRDAKRAPNCVLRESYADCELVDSRGAAYLIEGAQIVRIEYRASSTSSAQLPFGLKLGMPISTAIKLVDSHVKNITLSNSFVDDHVAISSGLCRANGEDSDTEFYLTFDRAGQLKTVGMRLETASD